MTDFNDAYFSLFDLFYCELDFPLFDYDSYSGSWVVWVVAVGYARVGCVSCILLIKLDKGVAYWT